MLRSETIQAIATFQQRRNRLLYGRATLLAGSILLALFLIIALIDRATFMPDAIRKLLSYATWFFTILFCIWQTWRLKHQHRNLHDAAQLMEYADPLLREKLLAAVELSNPESASNDSPEFRAKLQDVVAEHLRNFQPEKILPFQLLKPTLQLLILSFFVIVALSFVPQLHLPGFITRAALPFANIGRPSSTKIHILNPEQDHIRVPFSSQTLLTAKIDGPIPKHVIIEQIPDALDAKSTRLEMTSVGDQRYESILHVEQTNLRYRIHAGDAITPWLTLEARPRPRVIEFTKVITPPSYTKLPPQTLTEEHGDIAALEGSVLDISIATNQPLQASTAMLLPGKSQVTLKPDKDVTNAPQKFQISIDGKSDSWQLQLISEETGFTNEDDSPWRIQTIPDQAPHITLITPVTDQTTRPDQVLQISGEANDDIGLTKLELSHSINGIEWTNTELPLSANDDSSRITNQSIQTTLPLDPLPLNNGDALLIKLVATDLKGQPSESNIARLLIITGQPDQQLRTWAHTQQQLAMQAKALQQEMRIARRQAEAIRNDNNDSPESQAAFTNLKQQINTVRELTDQLWEQTKIAARQAPNSLKQLETNLVAQQLASLRNDTLPTLQKELSKPAPEDSKTLRQSANEAASTTDLLNEALRTFATADLAQTTKEAFEIFAPQQHQLAEKAIDANRDSQQRIRWQEKQKAAVAAARSAQQYLQSLHAIAPDNRQREIQNQLNNLNQKIPGVESSFDTKEQHQAPEYLYGQSHELRNATNKTRDFARSLAEESQNRADEFRNRLLQQNQPALNTLKRASDRLAHAASKKDDPQSKAETIQSATEKLKAAADQFQAQSELREQNPATNTQAALDQNRLSRAIDKLAQQIPPDGDREQLQPLIKQIQNLIETSRTLETDAALQQVQAALNEGRQSTENQGSPPQQLPSALAAESQLRHLDKALQQIKAPKEAIEAAQSAKGQAERQKNELHNQISQLQNQNQDPNQPHQQYTPPTPNPVLDANQQAQQQVDIAQQALAANVQNARNELEHLTPKLSELAQAAAEALSQNRQATDMLAEKAPNQTAEQNAQATQELLPEAQNSVEQLADLQAALRQEIAHAKMTDLAQMQMARTADVALAQMQQQTPEITNNLQQAVQSPQVAQQQQSLQNAAKAQQQTSNALNQLSQNLANMEQGKTLPQDALAAQQAIEEALGIKESLDESYQSLEEINELMQQAKDSPQKTLAALEKALQSNPQMQLALSQLSKKSASDSQSNLDPVMSQPEQLPDLAPNVAHNLSRVARHQMRLNQNEAAQQISSASQQLQQLAKDEATSENASVAAQAAQKAEQISSLTAQKTAESTLPGSLLQTTKGALLAHALDQLDQAVNPMQSSDPDSSQQGQGQQQSAQAQQQAQQNLAKASQTQAQSMAQDRAQGKVPGQQSLAGNNPNQQPAATPNQNQPNNAPATDPTGNMTQTAPNLAVPTLNLVDRQSQSWGRLPAKMAKDLSEAIRQEPSPEYRPAIESYYKAIAEKAKQ